MGSSLKIPFDPQTAFMFSNDQEGQVDKDK